MFYLTFLLLKNAKQGNQSFEITNPIHTVSLVFESTLKRSIGPLHFLFSSSISARLVFHVSVGHVCVNQGWGPAVVCTGVKQGWKRGAGVGDKKEKRRKKMSDRGEKEKHN